MGNTWIVDMRHQVIQVAMGWTDSHLHQFEIDGHRTLLSGGGRRQEEQECQGPQQHGQLM